MKLCILSIAAFATLASAAEPGALRVRPAARDGGKVVELPVERYVAGVLAGEAGTFRSDEGLKAMAVAVRTFGLRMRGRHAAQGFDLCGNTHCQLVDLRGITARFEQAAQATAGEMLWFDGKPALACYSQSCGGRTEDASAVWPGAAIPYLKSRADAYCNRAGASWQWVADGRKLSEALQRSGLKAPKDVEHISIVQRTVSGRAFLVQLSGSGQSTPISASALRFAVGREIGWNAVRSEHWEVRGDGGQFLFQGSGSGHGAGMCQTGADQMGNEGKSYREILAYYYPGTLIGLTGRGLKWARLGGERVVVMTTQAGRDGRIVGLADRLAGSLGLWPTIEIRVYPDIETFRNVTGEPGWVAARAEGRRIHMQPLSGAALESTLRHELLHVMVEDRAAANVPVWFREGLVAFLATRDRHTAGGTPSDTGIRQRIDIVRARAANDDARARVAALVQRYGESTILNWLKQGLPPEAAQVHRPQSAKGS